MNKKIKVIELLNKIAKGEEVPKKIDYQEEIYKWDEEVLKYADHTGYTLEIYTKKIDLNEEVEILEDNTEEIEELEKEQEAIANPKTMLQEIRFYYDSNKMGDKINEIIRYIKRKDKNND